MLGGLEVVEVMRLRAAGLSVREIARRTGFARNTVRKYLRAPEVPKYGPRSAKASKLDAFKPYLERRMSEGVWNAERLLRELKGMGYEGGVTILKGYLHPLRPAGMPRLAVRYEVAPGEEAQVDFGVFPFLDDSGRKRNVLAFVMVLSFSRALSVAFVPQQDLSTLLRCHLQAFEQLGGVPRRVLYDNMRAVVAGRDGERVTFQPRLLDFALLAGYEPRACRPYRAQSKGRVERAIGYLRTSFWPAVKFTNLLDLNRQVEAWLAEVANVRLHGTTHQRPIDLLDVERKELQRLQPRAAFQALLAEERRVSRDAFVSFEGNRYAVPWKHAGRYVRVSASATVVEIRDELGVIATHPRGLVSGLTLHLPGQYHGAPLGDTARPGKALAFQVAGPEVEVRSLAAYDALAGSGS